MKLRKNGRKKTNESFQQRFKDSFFFDLKKQGGACYSVVFAFLQCSSFF